MLETDTQVRLNTFEEKHRIITRRVIFVGQKDIKHLVTIPIDGSHIGLDVRRCPTLLLRFIRIDGEHIAIDRIQVFTQSEMRILFRAVVKGNTQSAATAHEEIHQSVTVVVGKVC